MDTTEHERHPAVAGQVEQGVRPCALRDVDIADIMGWPRIGLPIAPDDLAHKLRLVAAAAEAVARERCASICAGIAAGYTGAARRLDGQHATHAAGQRDGANECAAAIRGHAGPLVAPADPKPRWFDLRA